ncbi:MAG: MFS transporter [Chloroflexi bacterium]|nr:MFS transporter [Chloroflexota bacterium]
MLSALLVATVVVPEVPRSELGQPPRKAQDKSQRTFADGLRYLWRNPQTAAALFVKSGQSITSSDTLLIIYGTQVFVVGEQGVASMALLWAAFGVGAVVGPLLTNRFSDDSVPVLRRLISVGFALIVLGWLLWGLAPSLELLALAVVVRAMGGSVNWTYSSVIIQQIVPDDYLGRVFSLDFAGFEFVQSISILAFGLLIDAAGGDTIAHIVYLSALVAVLPLLMWVGVVRGIEKRESAEAVNGEF